MRELHKIRDAALSLNPLDYAATLGLVAIYGVGTSIEDRPGTSLDFYRSAATVIPTLLVAVAIQGRVLELSSKLTFARRFRTILLAVVVFGGETGALMNDRPREDELGGAPVRLSRPDLSGATPSLSRARRDPSGSQDQRTSNDEEE